MTDLQIRIQREKQFHNQWAQQINLDDLLVEEAFESPTAIENHAVLKGFGDLSSKTILDLGCGAGESAVYFAKRGADVTGVDISEEFIKLAFELAKKHGVSIKAVAAPSNAMPFPDASFDFVYCNGVLHHVDLPSTAKEIYRLLKPSGKAMFIEPLPYNPLINIYRWMARDVRTEDETPLSFKQMRAFASIFKEYSHEEFWFVSLYMFVHFFVVRRWHPSKVRYWKKIIEVGPAYKSLFGTLQRIDQMILKILPFARAWCWNTVITVKK